MEYFTIGYTGLFLICFLSATLLAFPSEIFFLGLLSKGFDPYYCIAIATIGNSMGGVTNYFIGRIGNPKWLKKLGMDEKKIEKRKTIIQKNGSWMALFSWVPFIGDPLLISLGFFRVKLINVLLLMSLGKFLRYFFIAIYYLF